jgi:hypothetical protein
MTSVILLTQTFEIRRFYFRREHGREVLNIIALRNLENRLLRLKLSDPHQFCNRLPDHYILELGSCLPHGYQTANTFTSSDHSTNSKRLNILGTLGQDMPEPIDNCVCLFLICFRCTALVISPYLREPHQFQLSKYCLAVYCSPPSIKRVCLHPCLSLSLREKIFLQSC